MSTTILQFLLRVANKAACILASALDAEKSCNVWGFLWMFDS